MERNAYGITKSSKVKTKKDAKMPQKKQSWSKKGSTKLSKAKKFNWKKYLPIIAIVALVGGFFVWRSFAGTKLYPYQYSVYQCSNFDKDKVNLDDRCVNESAEAMTYRYYKGLLGKTPDTKGYAFWAQKFAGDRQKPTDIAASFINASSTLKNKSSEQFVRDLYKNMMGREGNNRGIFYWTARTGDKNWGRAKIAAHFASTTEAKIAQRTGFATYVKTAPKLEIKENAKKKQEERLYISAVRVNDAKKQYESIKGLVDNGRKNRDAAKSIARKSTPSRSDLSAIASNQRKVESYKKKVPSVQRKITIWKNRNKALYNEAKAVSDYSPDLSSKGIKDNYDKLVFYEAATKNITRDLNNLIQDISGQYKAAEGKYETELRRLAAEAAKNTGSGSGSSGSATQTLPGCNVPINKVRANSGSTCIKRVQAWAGIAQDGIWGPDTARAVLLRQQAIDKWNNAANTKTLYCASVWKGGRLTNAISDPIAGRCIYTKGSGYYSEGWAPLRCTNGGIVDDGDGSFFCR